TSSTRTSGRHTESTHRTPLLDGQTLPAAALGEAPAVAETIASMSEQAAVMLKESVNRSFETSLAEGVRFERRLFHAAVALADQKEGMAAFVEKRALRLTNR
ncbi:enoyl-CoA hydratase-related protein, partial [Streptomyces sp. NPDC050263]|uniref:enoyl-CoA hydratase-related protein n=1 Tax=Streptomyces sp. NPDC050263 TaxID=3155037 RepID=UPI00342453FC